MQSVVAVSADVSPLPPESPSATPFFGLIRPLGDLASATLTTVESGPAIRRPARRRPRQLGKRGSRPSSVSWRAVKRSRSLDDLDPLSRIRTIYPVSHAHDWTWQLGAWGVNQPALS